MHKWQLEQTELQWNKAGDEINYSTIYHIVNWESGKAIIQNKQRKMDCKMDKAAVFNWIYCANAEWDQSQWRWMRLDILLPFSSETLDVTRERERIGSGNDAEMNEWPKHKWNPCHPKWGMAGVNMEGEGKSGPFDLA